MNVEEEWRDIPGMPGYLASSKGRVVSLKRGKEGLKLPAVDEHGYLRVRLSVDGRAFSRRVHQLVALAFIGSRPDGMEVCHIDGNRTNNHVDNLRYDTCSANNLDKVTHGTHNMARKTHCKRGHEFTESNTALVKSPGRSVARRCRKCDVIRQTVYNARKKASS